MMMSVAEVNPFDEAFFEPTLDLINRKSAQIAVILSHIDKMPAIRCDDVLIIGIPFRHKVSKHRLKSMNSFVNRMASNGAEFNAIAYYSKKLEKRIAPSEYHVLADRLDYSPLYRIHCPMDDNVIIEYSANNYLFFRFNRLAHFDESRFGAAIKAVINSNLFEFNHRTDRTNKRIYNAVRNLIIRNFYISSYEFDFILNPACSAVAYKALTGMINRKVNGVRHVLNTFYLYGSKDTDFNVKAYNITVNEDSTRRNLSPEYRSSDRLKLEITYKRPWFRDHDDLTIKDFTMQNVIADLLNEPNQRLLFRYFFDRLEPEERRAFQLAAGVNSRSDLMSKFSNQGNTQVSIDKDRVEIANIKKDIEQLMQTMQTMMDYKIEQDKFNNEIKARLDLIDRQSEKYTQKNKLRLVK
jgi:hypothetical protein